ncbi:hypothetical protein [Pseudomonas folii]|uniref:Bacterial Ig-like domain-containing protein n=1 Tax=Pseudomonas folii TaxID=2762593 RepID=A0ABR7B455_9PSED|nr:hypothetical protein [Pseudomonas folii]MBC3951973.1 hypothetical protein [Pseudomonas folii]
MVIKAERPVILEVKGPSGNVPNGGVTRDTSFEVSGTASPGSQVMISYNGDLWAIDVPDTGRWLSFSSTLREGLQTLVVHEGDLASENWTFTIVVGGVDPEISRVDDANGNPILNGGSTEDTRVTFSGSAEANSWVELLDDTISWGTVQVSISGTWSKPVAGLGAGTHRFKIRDTTSHLESQPWVFTVVLE